MSEQTILVVEDDTSIREIVCDILQVAGYRPLCTDNATVALGLVVTDRPDLIILDVMMPGMSGIDLLVMLRDNPAWQDIPVILESAIVETDKKVRGLLQGADDYLVKPFDIDELLARVVAVLRRSQRQG